jgi:hypothetical protein
MAFVLDDDLIRRLVNILVRETSEGSKADEISHHEDIVCEATFFDGTEMQNASVEDILALPNSRRSRIKAIRVSTLYRSRVRASIRFNNQRIAPVSYYLSGENRDVLVLSDKLDDFLPQIRPTWSPLARFSFVMFFVILYIASFTLASLYLAFSYVFFPNELSGTTSESPPGSTSLFLAVVFLIFVVGLVLDWIRTKLFPMGTFAIGQGVKRSRNLNFARGVFLTAIIIPVLLELIFILLGSS